MNTAVKGLRYTTLEETLLILEKDYKEGITTACYQLTTNQFPCDGICAVCLFGGKIKDRIKNVKAKIKELTK